MNRRDFLTAIAAIAASKFIPRKPPASEGLVHLGEPMIPFYSYLTNCQARAVDGGLSIRYIREWDKRAAYEHRALPVRVLSEEQFRLIWTPDDGEPPIQLIKPPNFNRNAFVLKWPKL